MVARGGEVASSCIFSARFPAQEPQALLSAVTVMAGVLRNVWRRVGTLETHTAIVAVKTRKSEAFACGQMEPRNQGP